jgi:hypothetical protein
MVPAYNFQVPCMAGKDKRMTDSGEVMPYGDNGDLGD